MGPANGTRPTLGYTFSFSILEGDPEFSSKRLKTTGEAKASKSRFRKLTTRAMFTVGKMATASVSPSCTTRWRSILGGLDLAF